MGKRDPKVQITPMSGSNGRRIRVTTTSGSGRTHREKSTIVTGATAGRARKNAEKQAERQAAVHHAQNQASDGW